MFPFDSEFLFLKTFVVIGCLLVIVTLLFKISAAPFHFWSPDVYEGSPLSSTVIFSVLPKIVIFTFLIKWIFTISDIFNDVKIVFAVSSILSVLLGTFFALKQKRIKKLIIFSSIAQVGFLISPFCINTLDGYFSLYFFLIIYIITSILTWGNVVIMQNSQKKLNFFFNTNSVSLFLSSLSNLFVSIKFGHFLFYLFFFQFLEYLLY